MHKSQYLVGLFTLLISNALVQLPAYFLRLVIDGLTYASDDNPQTVGIDLSQAGLYALGIVGTSLTSGLLMVLLRRKLVVASRQTEYELRRDIFAHLQTLDKHYYDRARTGDLMNRLTGDLSAVREMLGFGVWQLVNIALGFGMGFAVMFSLSWRLTLIVMAVIPFIVFGLSYMSRLINKRHKLVQEQNSVISAKAQENFSGARVVKGYAIEGREVDEYQSLNLELLKRSISLTKVEGPMRSFAGLMMGLAFAVVLLVGGKLILQPGSSFSPGKLAQFLVTLERMAFPMMAVGWITGITQRGSASWQRLRELLDARPQVKDDLGKLDPTVLAPTVRQWRGDLRFEQVSLQYGQTSILRDINLEIPAGTVLGITGPTGSGKTVLGQLITRALDPSSGVVRLDGLPLEQIPLEVLREQIAVVPQEPFLFSDSIANNIAFGLDNQNLPTVPVKVSVVGQPRLPELPQQPDLEKVRWAARLAGLDGDIQEFPHQYDTILGERGVTLSGGQRQRTALARAIIREPRILILDDSLSAVDTETEHRILEGLFQMNKQGQTSQGRTVILIAHRISTLMHADHIVVLQEGRIIEQGSHADLVERGGHYAELERLQRLASDLESGGEA